MTQRFTLFSEEVEDFVLEIYIDSNATFQELHHLILEACGYADQQVHLFLICDEDWRVKQRIRQADNGKLRSDEDLFLMKDTHLEDFIEDEGQYLAYVFDPENKRHFLMELTENIFGQSLATPRINRRHGAAPVQILQEEEETIPLPTPQPLPDEEDEEFYDSDGFEEDEIDKEGFEINE